MEAIPDRAARPQPHLTFDIRFRCKPVAWMVATALAFSAYVEAATTPTPKDYRQESICAVADEAGSFCDSQLGQGVNWVAEVIDSPTAHQVGSDLFLAASGLFAAGGVMSVRRRRTRPAPLAESPGATLPARIDWREVEQLEELFAWRPNDGIERPND